VLDKGIVIAGDIQINLLDIELLTLKLRLLIASADTARSMGIDWWEHDPRLSSSARDDALSRENEELRARLTRIRNRRGPEHLHAILRKFDPAEAKNLGPRDWPRVQRAIEFHLQTGAPISKHRGLREAPGEHAGRIKLFVLNPPRDALYSRINARTEIHFANGLVDEVQRLLDAGIPADSNALGAHGYRRVVEFLRGERDLPAAVEQTKLDVRHYAKRQLTWFRREPGVHWIERFGDDPLALAELMRQLESPT